MNDSQITIFYSWQSDLPGNETRNIIQDGIKDAVRLLRDTVEIEADRDTKGEYGSPDIAHDDIFQMGNLKQKFSFSTSSSFELLGEPEEKEKYHKLMSLEYKLHQIKMYDWYITTFDGYLLIPLAIVNVSIIPDEGIDIFISLDETKAEVVLPSKKLINPDMQGLEGLLYDDGIIKNLLMMPESSDISYDTDISYNLADSLAKSQATLRTHFGENGISNYNSEDYERELSKYIATPMDNNEFTFYVGSLRAKEKKWIGPALLIKPLADSFDIKYTIKSKKSDGGLNGTISY